MVYVHCTANRQQFLREQTRFEQLCITGEQVSKATSLMYGWLQTNQNRQPSRHKKEWETALKKSFTDEQWENACILAHKCSISAGTQETSYKVLTNWYFTPARLHAWYPEATDVCWRCGAETGTMLHIWWECSHIRNFWDEVCAQIHAITETELEFSPECCLLHLSNYSLSRYKKSVVRHMLNAAKTIIPRHWKSTHTLKLTEWLSQVDSLYRMEETVAMASEITDKFHKLWKSWFIFKYSDDFAKMQNG